MRFTKIILKITNVQENKKYNKKFSQKIKKNILDPFGRVVIVVVDIESPSVICMFIKMQYIYLYNMIFTV